MPLALEPLLLLRPDATRRFLVAALAMGCPRARDLAAAGVPHYEANDYCRRLAAAGELGDAGWAGDAREAYRVLVEARPPRRLDRLQATERPREKALRTGIGALSDVELMALLLRTGAGDEGVLEFAQRLIDDHDGLVGLAGMDVEELVAAHGLGPAKAGELAAAFELARRLAQAQRRQRPTLRTPEEVVAALGADLLRLRHEELWCLPLDPHSRLIGEPHIVSLGDVDGTDAGPRAFFRLAIAAGATSAIAVHNHPSGDVTPSAADRAVTARLVAAGRTLDIPLVDHVVVAENGQFTSLRREAPSLFR